jgi:hypothetical protein
MLKTENCKVDREFEHRKAIRQNIAFILTLDIHESCKLIEPDCRSCETVATKHGVVSYTWYIRLRMRSRMRCTTSMEPTIKRKKRVPDYKDSCLHRWSSAAGFRIITRCNRSIPSLKSPAKIVVKHDKKYSTNEQCKPSGQMTYTGNVV